MISTIMNIINGIGSFVVRFITDYISNVIVTTLIFPAQILKNEYITFNNMIKPFAINF